MHQLKRNGILLAGLCCYLTLWLWIPTHSFANDGILWRKDYLTARKESAETGKPLYLVFGSDECFHCKRLDASTFRELPIIRFLNENFVPIKIDARKEQNLTQSLRIQSYPTQIIAGNDGRILGTIEGFLDSVRLRDHLNRGLAATEPVALQKDFLAAQQFFQAGRYTEGLPLLQRVLADGKARPVQLQARLLLNQYEKQAEERYLKLTADYPKLTETQREAELKHISTLYPQTRAADAATRTLVASAENTKQTSSKEVADPQLAKAYLTEIKQLLSQEKNLTAWMLTDRLVQKYPDATETKEALGLVEKLKRDATGLEKTLAQLKGEEAKLYAQLGEWNRLAGNKQQAGEMYQKSISTAPESDTAKVARQAMQEMGEKVVPAVPVRFQKP